MGILAKTLSPASAYAAKVNGLWGALMDRLTDCMLPEDVDAFERHVIGLGLAVPDGWQVEIAEKVAARRQEIKEDDISEIMRSKFDF